jgi:hypothetical protein
MLNNIGSLVLAVAITTAAFLVPLYIEVGMTRQIELRQWTQPRSRSNRPLASGSPADSSKLPAGKAKNTLPSPFPQSRLFAVSLPTGFQQGSFLAVPEAFPKARVARRFQDLHQLRSLKTAELKAELDYGKGDAVTVATPFEKYSIIDILDQLLTVEPVPIPFQVVDLSPSHQQASEINSPPSSVVGQQGSAGAAGASLGVLVSMLIGRHRTDLDAAFLVSPSLQLAAKQTAVNHNDGGQLAEAASMLESDPMTATVRWNSWGKKVFRILVPQSGSTAPVDGQPAPPPRIGKRPFQLKQVGKSWDEAQLTSQGDNGPSTNYLSLRDLWQLKVAPIDGVGSAPVQLRGTTRLLIRDSLAPHALATPQSNLIGQDWPDQAHNWLLQEWDDILALTADLLDNALSPLSGLVENAIMTLPPLSLTTIRDSGAEVSSVGVAERRALPMEDTVDGVVGRQAATTSSHQLCSALAHRWQILMRVDSLIEMLSNHFGFTRRRRNKGKEEGAAEEEEEIVPKKHSGGGVGNSNKVGLVFYPPATARAPTPGGQETPSTAFTSPKLALDSLLTAVAAERRHLVSLGRCHHCRNPAVDSSPSGNLSYPLKDTGEAERSCAEAFSSLSQPKTEGLGSLILLSSEASLWTALRRGDGGAISNSRGVAAADTKDWDILHTFLAVSAFVVAILTAVALVGGLLKNCRSKAARGKTSPTL